MAGEEVRGREGWAGEVRGGVGGVAGEAVRGGVGR